MKRIAIAFSLLFTFFAPPVQAADNIVRITSTPHQMFDGAFRNDELAKDLLPDGRLGKLVFAPIAVRTWVIDPELLTEVVTMTSPYKINGKVEPSGEDAAKKWLAQLRLVTSRDRVIALAYGNPDVAIANRLAPSELKFYYTYGKTVAESVLGREVLSNPGQNYGVGKSRITNAQRKVYAQNRRALTALSTVVKDEEILALRAHLAVLLSPTLYRDDREYFTFQSKIAVAKTLSKLRISAGKYQLTTERVKLPVTLVNEFSVPVTVDVELIQMNSRVMLQNVPDVTIEPKSRLQLAVPVTVVAPGSTTVLAQLTNNDGVKVSKTVSLSLNSTIIDPRVTWFTTGAGILLLLGGIAQSVRRVKRGRHENS